ncbi:hypothetical protein GEMRC1_000323 [Eukaryota sp. GEM-RC1]
MSSIEFWLRELESELDYIDTTLSSASSGNLPNEKLTQIVKTVEDKLHRTNLDIRQARTMLVDVDWKRDEYEERLNEAASRRTKLQEFHQDVKRKCNRSNLIGDKENLTDGQKVRAAQIIAEDTSKKIKYGRNMLANIEFTGIAAGDELRSHTQTLERVHNSQQELRSELKIADQQIRVFLRSMMTDKFIMLTLLTIVLGLIFIIIYSVFNPDSDLNVPDEFKPQ